MKQIIVKFFEPLNKHRFWTLSASIIIGIALYVGVDIGLAEVVRQNSYDMHMLGAELLTESSPDSAEVSKDYAKMLQLYTEHIKQRQRQFAAALRVLYPRYSPEKALASATKALEDATNEEEAREAIWQAGVASDQLYTLGKRFPRSPIGWFDSEDVPDRWLEELDSALAESSELVDGLEKEQTPDSAKAACVANRKTMLLLFPAARLGSDREEIEKKVKDFLSIVGRAQGYTTNVASKERIVETKEQILKWARNEERRVNILNAMLDNDMDKVCNLLRETVEKAYEEREGEEEEGEEEPLEWPPRQGPVEY